MDNPLNVVVGKPSVKPSTMHSVLPLQHCTKLVMVSQSATVVLIYPKPVKTESVSFAPVGFTHAAFPFSINYTLWSHTWQWTQYRERCNKAVGTVSKTSWETTIGCNPFISYKWRGNHTQGKCHQELQRLTGKTMECARRNLKCRIIPLDSQLYNMQVRMFSPVKTQL